jgi:hypothetical protein
MRLLLLALLSFLAIAVSPLHAADCPTSSQPASAGADIHAQSSCCAGRRGACGCRGSRVICCDGSQSSCACHADDTDELRPDERDYALDAVSAVLVSATVRK